MAVALAPLDSLAVPLPLEEQQEAGMPLVLQHSQAAMLLGLLHSKDVVPDRATSWRVWQRLWEGGLGKTWLTASAFQAEVRGQIPDPAERFSA